MSNCGCAQDADRNLLSPSKIQWFNDSDHNIPISGGTNLADALPAAVSADLGPQCPMASSAKMTMPTTLDRFLPLANPASSEAGTQRSGCTIPPSTKITDPDNAELHVFLSASAKWKACTHGSRPCQVQKVVLDSDGSDNEVIGGDSQEGKTTNVNNPTVELIENESTDEDSEDVMAHYASTKALGDANHKVCDWYQCFYFMSRGEYIFDQLSNHSKADKTTDTCMIFVAEVNHLNPDTGSVESRKICTLCK